MKFKITRRRLYAVSIVYSSRSSLNTFWSDRPECMMRQNLFPIGVVIRFSTAMRVTTTFLPGATFFFAAASRFPSFLLSQA